MRCLNMGAKLTADSRTCFCFLPSRTFFELAKGSLNFVSIFRTPTWQDSHGASIMSKCRLAIMTSVTSVTQGPSVAPLFTSRRGSSASRDEIVRLIQECDGKLLHEPNCFHTRAVRAHACVKARLWDHAVDDFTSILHDRPDDIHSRFSRGMALFKIGRVEEAHADFSRVLQLNPRHVMARYARAGCYNTEGKFHRAIEDYTIALQHDEQESEKVLLGLRSDKARAQNKSHGAAKHIGGERSDIGMMRNTAHKGGLVNDGNELRRALGLEQSPPHSNVLSEPRIQGEVEHPSTPTPVLSGEGSCRNASTTLKRPRKVVQVRLSLTDLAPQPDLRTVLPTRVEPTIATPQLAAPIGMPLFHAISLHASEKSNGNDLVERSPCVESPVPPAEAVNPICNHSTTSTRGSQRQAVRRVTVAL